MSAAAGLHSRPACLSTPAGTPTSRSRGADVRFAQEAATFTNASSSSGSRAAWPILSKLSVDVDTLLNQLDLRIGEDSSAIHCSICARRFSRLARLGAGTFGARSADR